MAYPDNPRPTIKDVAARAGVSMKTVSRVINDEPRVSPATAQAVRDAVAELGFRRNDGARLLRQGHTATVGLVLEDVADPFYSILSRAVEEVAHQAGSLLLAGSSAEDPVRERELILNFCSRRVDGLVIVPTRAPHDYLVPEVAAGVAAVFVDRPPTGIAADAVLAANAEGAGEGVAHLVAHGHRRIAFLGDHEEIFTAAQRLAGYRAALDDAGIGYDPCLVDMAPPRQDRIAATLARLLAGADPATAIFSGNSRITVAVLRALAGTADRPALVGFDDFELADLLTPGVTVVAQDPAGMGRAASELLFGRLGGDRGPVRQICLPTRLIPRGSGELRRR